MATRDNAAAHAPEWLAFIEELEQIYLPGFAPEARVMSRPDVPEGQEGLVPDDIWFAALMIFPEPEYWLANPIPNLKRRSPLELLKRGEGVALRENIMAVAPFFLPDPSEVVPWEEAFGAPAARDEEG